MTPTNRTITFKEDPSKGPLGLGANGRSKMPNCVDIIQPGKGFDGRWKTGLDELSSSINEILESKEREKKYKEVKAEREELERLLNVDLSGTSTFWETFFVEINPHRPLNLVIPLDRVKLSVLLAGDSVSPSIRESKLSKYKNAKFYISREFEEVGEKVAKKKKYGEAVAALVGLIKSPDRAVMIGRYLDLPIKANMPSDNMFDMFQTYLDDDDNLNSIDRFLAAVNKNPEEINIKLIFSDAVKFRVIRNNDGNFQRGNITMGKTADEVIKWLNSVANSGELLSIAEEVEQKRKFA